LSKAGARFVHADIRNTADIDTFFSAERDIGVVLHMAAQVAFKVSVLQPRLDFEINALGTFNLLEAVRRFHSRAIFIYASTNQVYGALPADLFLESDKRYDYVTPCAGIQETDRLDFLSPYGCSKGSGDLYTLDYARIYGLNSAVARFGGIYGIHQYSMEDHGWVSYIAEMVQRGVAFNRFGHGKQVRDILFCTDIVDAIDKMIINIDKVKGEALNIAGGKGNSVSVLELLEQLEQLTGKKERSIINPMRAGDKLVCYLDTAKAERLLNWRPKISKNQGLSKLLEWIAIKHGP